MLPTITVDVGTTSVKLCLFDAHGHLVASAKRATPNVRDADGEVYDVDALWGGITRFVGALTAQQRETVSRIAVTGVGESGGLVRGDMSLASPMILWHDQRGAEYLARLSGEQRSRVYRVTGLPANGNYGLSKVAWAVDRATRLGDARWLNIAEYLAALMTGERQAEPSLASRTMALDLSTGLWSEEIAGFFGVDVGVFPPLRPAVEGTLITPAFAAETGLRGDVRVHVAGHDHMVGSVGAALQPGELLNSTGTTEGLLFLRDAPRLDDHAQSSKLANGFDCAGAGYTLFASIPTGGSAFATLQRMLGLDAARLAAVIDDVHAQYLEGAINLDRLPIVLPQFRGSPPPTKRSSARGLMAGINGDTALEEIVFATFLGMTLQFRDVLELFEVPVSEVKVIGPASGNPLWLRLKADLLRVPLSASQFPEVVSRGAQALASGDTWAWRDNQPHDVAPDERRHARLAGWAADVRTRWEYLKELPG